MPCPHGRASASRGTFITQGLMRADERPLLLMQAAQPGTSRVGQLEAGCEANPSGWQCLSLGGSASPTSQHQEPLTCSAYFK